MVWITFTSLAVIFFTVGCIMLNRIRLYFKGFYEEYGCYLWASNVLLTLPLTFRAVFDALRKNDEWWNFWIIDGSIMNAIQLIHRIQHLALITLGDALRATDV